MKTSRVLRVFKQVFNITLVLLMLAGLFGWGVSRAAAENQILADPIPTIEVDPLGHWAHAVDWPNGTSVHMTIVRPPAVDPAYAADAVVGPAPWNPASMVATFNLLEPQYDLQTGDVVTMVGASITRSMTVMALLVTGVDAAANTVSGTASAADGNVFIGVSGGGPGQTVSVSVGTWTVNFSPYDLVPGSNGGAWQYDANGNSTRADWRVQRPWIRADVKDSWVQAGEWPLGATLTMTINGSGSYTATEGLSNPGDIFSTFAQFSSLTLHSGDILAITDGTTPKSYTITNLQVTGFNVDTDTITGLATPGATVHLCANVAGTCIPLSAVAAAGTGEWTANYTGLFDLKAGSTGTAYEENTVGDQTWVNWAVPNASVEVDLTAFWARGYDWPNGTSIHLTIVRPPATEPAYSADAVVGPAAWNPALIIANFNLLSPRYDLLPGDIVTMAGGGTTRSMIVTALHVTGGHAAANTITGTGSAAEGLVHVSANAGTRGRIVSVGAGGTWTADFSPFDLTPGMTGAAWQLDANGNSTRVDWTVNNAPEANAQSVTTNEDTAKAITLTGSDVESSTLTFTVLTQPTKGVLSGTAPNLTYTPTLNLNGPDSFTFKVNDGTDDSNTATVSITLTPVNDLPVANAQSVTTDEDTVKAITLTGTDADLETLSFTVLTQPTKGALSGTAPNLTYTPTLNLNGPDSFTFKVNDGHGDSPAATVSITITAVNDLPVANAQSVTTNEDTAKAITLTGTDADLESLAFTVVTQPAKGALSGSAPNLTYTPTSNLNGPDSFTFKVNDGHGDSPAATVSITITAVNDLPVANAQSVTTDEDTAKAITLTGTDADLDTLSFTVLTQPTKGALSGSAPNLTYTPTLNLNGPDSFTFKVNDSHGDSNTATVSITITAVNDLPVANAQSVTTDEDTAKAITLTGSDVESTLLTYTVVTQPTKGVLSGSAPDLTYTPTANLNGPDSFTFKVNDGTADSPAATVSITITAVNDLPEANAQSVTTDEDTLKAITLTGTDGDGDSLTYTVLTLPTKGALSGTAPDLTYTPYLDLNGSDSFTFKVNDGTGDSLPATLSITITPVNDPPVIMEGATASVSMSNNGTPTPFDLTLHAIDIEAHALTWSLSAAAQHGTAYAVGTGSSWPIIYTPNADYIGPDSFSVQVSDGSLTDTITVNVSVLATWQLSVSLAGTGSGKVTSLPAGIDCGTSCSVIFDDNTSVTLKAEPVAGSIFAGWSGACTGTGDCIVSMSAARSVTAHFDLILFWVYLPISTR